MRGKSLGGFRQFRGAVGAHGDKFNACSRKSLLPFTARKYAVHLTGREHCSNAPQVRNGSLANADHVIPIKRDERASHVRQVIGVALAGSRGNAGSDHAEHHGAIGDSPHHRLQRGRGERHHDVGLLFVDRSDDGAERANIQLRIAQ